jgi:2,3-dihydroxyphenylpropionate 1,2-dioxygenase
MRPRLHDQAVGALPTEQRDALITLDLPSIVKMGAHPLMPFLAQLQMKRQRPQG